MAAKKKQKQTMDFDEASLLLCEGMSDDAPTGAKLALTMSLHLERLVTWDEAADTYTIDWDRPIADAATEMETLLRAAIAG